MKDAAEAWLWAVAALCAAILSAAGLQIARACLLKVCV